MNNVVKIITITILCIITACNPDKQIKEMNKETFWSIIEDAKKKSGTNLDKRYSILVSKLKDYDVNDIIKFHKIAGVYIGSAEENLSLWGACKAIEGYASDDTYLYFCCWLVSQGYEVYKNAAKNPDYLADIPDIGKYKDDGHTFEMLMAAPFEAYQLKTGESLYEKMSDPEEIEKFPDFSKPLNDTEIDGLLDGIEFMNDAPFRESEETAKRNIPRYLPKLTNKFGYNPEEDLREMEEFMKDPEAGLEQIKEMLMAQGIDVSNMPEFQPQPPKPASAKNYDEMWRYSKGLAAVKKDNKWGFIDEQGKEVIPVKYDMVMSFPEHSFMPDIIVVQYGGKYGYINRQGIEITPFKYDIASMFINEKYAWVEMDGKKGFINLKGEEIISPRYDELHFGDKIIKGKIDNRWEEIKFE